MRDNVILNVWWPERCPKWGALGCNEVLTRGSVLFWRQYAFCCGCHNERRVR